MIPFEHAVKLQTSIGLPFFQDLDDLDDFGHRQKVTKTLVVIEIWTTWTTWTISFYCREKNKILQEVGHALEAQLRHWSTVLVKCE
jgi:hypothetical protein